MKQCESLISNISLWTTCPPCPQLLGFSYPPLHPKICFLGLQGQKVQKSNFFKQSQSNSSKTYPGGNIKWIYKRGDFCFTVPVFIKILEYISQILGKLQALFLFFIKGKFWTSLPKKSFYYNRYYFSFTSSASSRIWNMWKLRQVNKCMYHELNYFLLSNSTRGFNTPKLCILS